MKVAFVSQPFDTVRPPTPNSVGLWTHEVAKRLVPSWNVTVYGRIGDDDPPMLVHDDVVYRFVSQSVDARLQRLYPYLPRPRSRFKPGFALYRYYIAYALQIARSIREHGADIIHIMNFPHFAPIIRAFNPHAKIVLNMQCEWLSQLDQRMMRRRLRAVDAIMGCSNHVTDLARHRFSDFTGHFFTTYSGVDADSMPGAQRGSSSEPLQANLLFVGRVSPEKGVHVLVEAMPELVRALPGLRLEIVGGQRQLDRAFLVDISDDPLVQALARFYPPEAELGYFDHLRLRVGELGLEEQVTFTGALPHEQVLQAYRRADVLVNPSLSESFGRSIVEAMAQGVAVIGTRVGGMQETVEPRATGLLVDPEDRAGLVEAIVALTSDRNLHDRLVSSAWRRVRERFSWEAVTQSVQAHYAALTS